MKRRALLWSLALSLSTWSATAADNGKKYDFPIYKNNPPGRQLTGGHAPATTPPLVPEETRQKIQVPPGFEVRLFAAEPEVVNPVAMTWDERGRLWVLELYEYPKGAPRGTKGRDRIKILEDTDADGRADKVTVFADGYSLATGMELGDGGVYLGVAPDFLFLEDVDGDDVVDKETVLLTGFGLEDRHELLNGFAWGPDGWLYMTHGVFTHSKVRDPAQPDRGAVTVDAALARYHPLKEEFEVFADGTSNPWGVDWNARGDAFVSACVIHHLFHMAPGGQYNRQGGTWANPFGYVRDLPSRGLPAAVDWRHFRAAHAGITVYQGNQYPKEWQGLVFLGNIHQNALNCDRLIPVGSTYIAEKESTLLGKDQGHQKVGAGNFLVSEDPWFRPVAVKTGPDGALWVMDWSDRYPCYQNAQADPEGVDREYGRIWRVVWVGDQPGQPRPSRPDPNMNLRELSFMELVQLLNHDNVWQRRQAQRLIRERADDLTDPQVEALHRALADANDLDAQLALAWTLHAADLLQDSAASALAASSRPAVRSWMARHYGQQIASLHQDAGKVSFQELRKLARDDDSTVRANAAVGLRLATAGTLTVNPPSPRDIESSEVWRVASELMAHPSLSGDTYYPHIVWMAVEPIASTQPEPFLQLLASADNSVSAYGAYRIMRRICDQTDATVRASQLNTALPWLATVASQTQLAGAALDGLITAFETQVTMPSVDLDPVFTALMKNEALTDRTRRLAALLGDKSAAKVLLAAITDPDAPVADRLQGIQAASEAKSDAARSALLASLASDPDQTVRVAAVRALASFGGDSIAYQIVDAWGGFSPSTRRAAAEVLVTRTKWARALLAGIDRKKVDPQDISATARRALAQSPDSTIVDHATQVLGAYRATAGDKLKLIASKREMVLSGKPDLEKGREMARTACFVCHKLYGEGADVGPDLTGVGRSSLDALLHNIIDPNEVIGNGYEATEVELKDGTLIMGRVVEDTPSRLKLVATGPVEHTLSKNDIASSDGQLKIRRLDISLMPEGLEQMPDEDFRNLIWFLLNPPEDNRPWTPALRRELLGDETAGQPPQKAAGNDAFRGQGHTPSDGESVALWNPDWRVLCPPFEGAPKKLTEYAGRRNVLMTHPVDRHQPSGLERTLDIPKAGRTVLRLRAASDDHGDWQLRVLANGKLLHQQVIDGRGRQWHPVQVDLTSLSGQSVTLRLENAANDWNYEFGYWSEIEIETSALRAAIP